MEYFFCESAWGVKTVQIGCCFLGPQKKCPWASPLRHSGETMVTERFRSPHERESKTVLSSEFQGGFRIQKWYWIPDSSRWRDCGFRFLGFAVAKFPIPKPRIPNFATKKYPGFHITSYEVIRKYVISAFSSKTSNFCQGFSCCPYN